MRNSRVARNLRVRKNTQKTRTAKVMAFMLTVTMLLALFPFSALANSETNPDPAQKQEAVAVKEDPKEGSGKEEPSKASEPAKEEPAKEEPAKEEPAKEEPVAEEPAVTEEPTESAVENDKEPAQRQR